MATRKLEGAVLRVVVEVPAYTANRNQPRD